MRTKKLICVVTGASSGIGRATALELARRDVSLVLSGRNEARLVEVGGDCREHGVQVLEVAGDVAHEDYAERLFEKASELREWASTRGGVEKASRVEMAAVFAAGVATFGPTLEQPKEIWDAHVATNLTGLYNCCRAAIGAMSDGGRIVNVLSIASKHAFAQSAAYVATKFAGYGLTQSLAAEFRERAIRFTAFMPGSTDTPLWEPMDWTPERSDMLAAEEVGSAIADIVCSEHSGVYDEVVFLPPKGIL